MRYKVVFSGLSCMAYLSIIFQKLFYKPNKRRKIIEPEASEGDNGPKEVSHSGGNAEGKRADDRLVNKTVNGKSSTVKPSIDPPTCKSSNTPSNMSSASTTDRHPYDNNTNRPNPVNSTSYLGKMEKDATNNPTDSINNGIVEKKLLHTLESSNHS